jgi:hypothetical protein
LDYLIPINQQHLRRIVREFADYYNRGRPHSALVPGLPAPNQATAPVGKHRHMLPVGYGVVRTSVLAGLHHEYRLEKDVA